MNELRNHARSYRRSTAASLLTLALLTAASVLSDAGTAQAAEFNTCGHRVVTDYNQGWVRIKDMTGVTNRPDVRVTGWTGGPHAQWEYVNTTVEAAIYSGLLWAATGLSEIYIDNYPECTVKVH